MPAVALPILALLAACGGKQTPVEPPAPAADPAAAQAAADQALRASTAREVIAAMDLGADPCADFYRYACGGWLDSTQRPADQASWSRSFSTITENNRQILRALLEQAAADPGAGAQVAARAGLSGDDAAAAAADWQRLGLLYGSCMDEAGVEAAGLAPIEALLADIDGLRDRDGLLPLLGRLQARGVGGLWAFDVWGDLKAPDVNMAYVEQAGLGLPDRDYYLRTDEASLALQQAYRAYIARLYTMGGWQEAGAAEGADRVYAFERALAELSLPRDQLRDPEKIYNPRTAAELEALMPGFGAWAQAMGLTLDGPVSVHDAGWFEGVAALLARTDAATLRAWLRFHALSGLADTLPDAWGVARFEFYGQQVMGQAQRKDRWKRCVDQANGVLGEALGRHYVLQHFAGDSKEIALQMVDGVEGAFEAGLPGLAWMDEQTRQRAAEKAAAVTEKIGYPDTWLDTSAMAIAAQPYAANALEAKRFHVGRALAKVGQPVDPAEWFMPPAIVNAYYNPLENEMVFPAGILQPPFFHRAFPAPMNYGAIGMVIGHELTHGFDDSGRKFDQTGAMTEWWAPEVAARFEGQAACVEQQYAGFDAVDGLKVNGKLTLGENIADLGGVKLAWTAWKAWEAEHGSPEPLVAELDNDQLFFVAYAQGWCTLMSPELEKMLVTTNPHSPPRYRVNGPLQNTPAFHEAFQCQDGQSMVRQPRCEVW